MRGSEKTQAICRSAKKITASQLVAKKDLVIVEELRRKVLSHLVIFRLFIHNICIAQISTDEQQLC